jgi:hypothetical protein
MDAITTEDRTTILYKDWRSVDSIVQGDLPLRITDNPTKKLCDAARYSIFESLVEDDLRPDGEVLWLTATCSRDQTARLRFGTSTHRSILFIDPTEMNRLGLRVGEIVTLETVSVDGVQRRLAGMMLVSHKLPTRCCIAYCRGANLPVIGAIPVRIMRSASGAV